MRTFFKSTPTGKIMPATSSPKSWETISLICLLMKIRKVIPKRKNRKEDYFHLSGKEIFAPTPRGWILKSMLEGFIFLEGRVVENHFFLICFTITSTFKKNKKFTSTNSWLASTLNFFSSRGRRREKILYQQWLWTVPKKLDCFILMNFRLLTLLMQVFYVVFSKSF